MTRPGRLVARVGTMAAVASLVAPAPAARGPDPRTPPAIIDLEASGFGRASYPIEVGYILGDGSTFCTLVRPAPGWTHWDPAAEAVHHISRELLERHGKPPLEVARLLNERLRGQTLYSDAWGHDFAWLSVLFEEAGVVPLFRIDSLRKVLDEQQAAVWKSARPRGGRVLGIATPGQRGRLAAAADLAAAAAPARRAVPGREPVRRPGGLSAPPPSVRGERRNGRGFRIAPKHGTP